MTTPPINVGSWTLAPADAAEAQGLIVSPFSHLPCAVALLLDTSAAPGPAWLRALRNPATGCPAVTPAVANYDKGAAIVPGCMALAFTAPGLWQLGVPGAVMEQFAAPFLEGMHAPNRRRRLADALLDPPTRRASPLWGGNAPASTGDPDAVVCARTVHAAILLYHQTEAQLAAFAAPVRACLAAANVAIAHELSLSLMADPDNKDLTREHFGFADGISQPVPFGDGIVTRAGAPYPRHPVHAIAAGDLVLGHINAHNEPAPGAPLPPGPTPGRNGSFLVIRELSQDPDAFWASMNQAATACGAPSGTWVAERVIGRTKDGAVLAEPAIEGNDFLFNATDPDGFGCPLGSHVRRANPRDGLAPTPSDRFTILNAANNHRILRRGRKYAATIPGNEPDLPARPGLLFMCLNTDLERQFEFVQQTWMMNPGFAALFDERDPLLGPAGPFTLQATPLRQRVDLGSFVHLIGGEYFFLPSLPAIDQLAALDELPTP